MASGVTVHEDCVAAISQLGKASKYIIFNLSEDKSQIIVEKVQSTEKPKAVDEIKSSHAGAMAPSAGPITEDKYEKDLYEEFVGNLPEKNCRWIVYNFVYKKEGGIREKHILICWSPDPAATKDKMLFSTSKQVFKNKVNTPIEIQATDLDEVSFNTVLEKVEPFNAKASWAR